MCQNQTCANCRYFHRHYIRSGKGRYYALLYGHCIKPRLKKRFCKDPACTYWQEVPHYNNSSL
ncbi:MAG: hypothetical protein ACOX6P_08300 [Candidatus Merdivicinus sp.]